MMEHPSILVQVSQIRALTYSSCRIQISSQNGLKEWDFNCPSLWDRLPHINAINQSLANSTNLYYACKLVVCTHVDHIHIKVLAERQNRKYGFERIVNSPSLRVWILKHAGGN